MGRITHAMMRGKEEVEEFEPKQLEEDKNFGELDAESKDFLEGLPEEELEEVIGKYDEQTYYDDILEKMGVKPDNLKPYKPENLDWEDLHTVAKEAVNIFLEDDPLIAILYDCDVDGIFAGYIPEDYFKRKGFRVVHYMNGLKTHGVVDETVEWVKEVRPDYLFVVDAGSGDVENLNKISDLGITCFVLDHHPYENKNPLNKNVFRLNCGDYAHLPHLSGCGVVYRFLEELSNLTGGNVKIYEKFVGITVLSDICDMSDRENRYYVLQAYKYYDSLEFFKQFPFYGSYHSMYTFGVIPYLNALVRVGEQEQIFDVLNYMNSTPKMMRISYSKREVRERQQAMMQKILEASNDSSTGAYFNLDGCYLLLRKEFPELKTVNGLVANSLINTYDKSALVMYYNKESGYWEGSFRGWNFDNTVLKEWGFECHGHLNACGAKIDNKGLLNFVKNFKYVGQHQAKYIYEIDDATVFSDKTWLKIAEFNEFSGSNMDAIIVKLDISEEDAIDVDEPTGANRKVYYFEGYEIVDFNKEANEDSKEFMVEAVIQKGSNKRYRLLRR